MPIQPIGAVGGELNSVLRKYTTLPNDASLLDSFSTDPKAQWASCEAVQLADDGGSVAPRYIATRTKMRLVGEWEWIAPVIFIGYQKDNDSPIGSGLTAPRGQFRLALELANGAQNSNFDSPNSGGTIIPWNVLGERDVTFFGGYLGIGEPKNAADFGLPSWNGNDRSANPWVRIAWDKGVSNVVLPVGQFTSYNAPCNSHTAVCSTYNAACTLIDTPGIANYNGGNDQWGATDSGSIPTVLGWIGKSIGSCSSVLWFGTSVPQGQGDSNSLPPGVNPSAHECVPSAYDLIGFPTRLAQGLTTGFPILNASVGGSCAADLFGDGGSGDWNTSLSHIQLQRLVLARLARFFTHIVVHDVTNDPPSGYLRTMRRNVAEFRSANPKAKLWSVRVPNGGATQSNGLVTTSTTYNSAYDARYSALATLQSEGLLDGELNVQSPGVQEFPTTAPRYSGTATGGTTTSLTNSSATWLRNELSGSFIIVNGQQRVVNTNDRTTLNLVGPATFPAPPSAGTGYTILGNCSSDGLHGNTYWNRNVAPTRLKLEIERLDPAFRFWTRAN